MAVKKLLGNLQVEGDIQVEYIKNNEAIKIKAGAVTIVVPYISDGEYIKLTDLPNYDELEYDSNETYYGYNANTGEYNVITRVNASTWSIFKSRLYIYQANDVKKSMIASQEGANFEILAGNTKVVVPYSSVGSYVSCAEMTYDSTATYYVYENDEYVAYDGEMTERYFNENKASLYIYQAGQTYNLAFPQKSGTVALLDDVALSPATGGGSTQHLYNHTIKYLDNSNKFSIHFVLQSLSNIPMTENEVLSFIKSKYNPNNNSFQRFTLLTSTEEEDVSLYILPVNQGYVDNNNNIIGIMFYNVPDVSIVDYMLNGVDSTCTFIGDTVTQSF